MDLNMDGQVEEGPSLQRRHKKRHSSLTGKIIDASIHNGLEKKIKHSVKQLAGDLGWGFVKLLADLGLLILLNLGARKHA